MITPNEFYKGKQRLCSKYRHRLANRPTESEIIFESLLKDLDINYRAQKGFMSQHKTFVILDFWVPKPYRVAIEIDGGYHDLPEQRIKDYNKDQYLKSRLFHIIRFKNEELLDVEKVKLRLLDFLEKAKNENTSKRKRKDRIILQSYSPLGLSPSPTPEPL